MPDSVKDYRELVEKPWGRMFYDLLYLRLSVPEAPRLRILDFGSGFGVCADHYAKRHDVTAIEPSADMLSLRFAENKYEQIHGGIEELARFREEFDLVLCHNVLEYTPGKEEIFRALAGALKRGGSLSIVKHNKYGKAMAAAVFQENPGKALDLLFGPGGEHDALFGGRELYDETDIPSWAEANRLALKSRYGIRAFFALTQNNDIKFAAGWYEKMLELEYKAGGIYEFRKISFFNHYILVK